MAANVLDRLHFVGGDDGSGDAELWEQLDDVARRGRVLLRAETGEMEPLRPAPDIEYGWGTDKPHDQVRALRGSVGRAGITGFNMPPTNYGFVGPKTMPDIDPIVEDNRRAS